jgi:hypothetical protein
MRRATAACSLTGASTAVERVHMWDDKLLISVLAGIMLVSLFVYGWLGGSFIGAETLAR